MVFNLEKLFSRALSILLFLLPWHTVWLYREPVIRGFKWEFGTLGFYAIEMWLWLCVILFALWFWQQKRLRVSDIKFSWSSDRFFLLSLLLFFLYGFVSVWWADDPALSLQQALRLLEAGLLFLIILLGSLSPRRVVVAFCAGLIWPVCLGIWQFLSQSTFASAWLGLSLHPAEELGTAVVQSGEFRYLRAYGSFAHPNIFGGYLVVGLFFTTVRILLERVPTVRTLWWHGLLLFEVMAVFFTFSRAAWIGGAIILAAYLWLSWQARSQTKDYVVQRITPFLIVIFVGILGWLYAPLVLSRLSVTTSIEVRSVSERVSGYQEALNIFRSDPWLGVGVGGYTARLHQLHPDAPGFALQPVHNIVLLLLAELGIVGMILLGFVLWCFWCLLRRKVLVFLPLFPLFLLDHYPLTSLPVLFATVIVCGVGIRVFYTDFPHLIHFFPRRIQNWLS